VWILISRDPAVWYPLKHEIFRFNIMSESIDYRLKTFQQPELFPVPGAKLLMFPNPDYSYSILNYTTGYRVTYMFSEGDWLMFDEEGFFTSSPGGDRLVALSSGFDYFSLEQFASSMNRPDLILERLGVGSPNQRSFYKLLHARRYGTGRSSITGLASPPRAAVELIDSDVREAEIEITVEKGDRALKSYNIFVNGVPLYPNSEKPVRSESGWREVVRLSSGLNRIEVAVTDKDGVVSNKPSLFAVGRESHVPRLYYVGLGISDYTSPDLKLDYAAKDAADLSDALSRLNDRYSEIIPNTAVDDEVSAGYLSKVADSLKDAHVDDVLVFFLAGHGMHTRGEEPEYYYLLRDSTESSLEETGLPFEAIEDFLSGLPMRKKLVFLDTCESGELYDIDFGSEAALSSLKSRSARGLSKVEAGTSREEQASSRLSENILAFLNRKDRYIYNSLRNVAGAKIFSSSRGVEVSYESDEYRNGLFTEAILEALNGRAADADGDGAVAFSELEGFVRRRVSEMAEGMQNPALDRDNRYFDLAF
jgi:uncharacterized caspase-like protein